MALNTRNYMAYTHITRSLWPDLRLRSPDKKKPSDLRIHTAPFVDSFIYSSPSPLKPVDSENFML